MKDIIRFYPTGKRKLIHYLVTEEQAREWCESKYTRKQLKNLSWFDGFAESGTYCQNQSPKYTHYFTPTEQD